MINPYPNKDFPYEKFGVAQDLVDPLGCYVGKPVLLDVKPVIDAEDRK